jgi:hypothetical protein
MNTKHFFTAVALTIAAASGPVLAQEATYDYPTVVTSQTTRAAVLADLALARAQGTLQVNEASVGHAHRFMAQRSRDAVRAEVRHTARNGAPLSTTAETNAFAIEAPQAAAPLTVANK